MTVAKKLGVYNCHYDDAVAMQHPPLLLGVGWPGQLTSIHEQKCGMPLSGPSSFRRVARPSLREIPILVVALLFSECHRG